MEAFALIAALLIVVAVPQLIANKYFPRERVSVKTELKKKKVIVDHPFKVTYTAVSSTENILGLRPLSFFCKENPSMSPHVMIFPHNSLVALL